MSDNPLDLVALESAVLALRRSNPSAMDKFIAALRADYEQAIFRLLSAGEPNFVMQTQGAAREKLDMLNRIEHAEATITRVEAAVAAAPQNRTRSP